MGFGLPNDFFAKNKATMKKVLFAFLMLLSCQLAFCQTAGSVFDDFRDKKHAEYISVPRLLTAVAASKMKDGKLASVVKNVKEAKVLTLNDCSKSVRRKFAKKVTALSKKGYDNFTGMKSGKDKDITVLVKQDGETISEIVALVLNDEVCVGILVVGSINVDDVAALIGMVGV